MADKPPDAFLSYTRFDDRHDGGAISEFRQRLADAVRAVTGAPFEIFQDVDDIDIGERWSQTLDEMLDSVRFFIPILTPSYFQSQGLPGRARKVPEGRGARRPHRPHPADPLHPMPGPRGGGAAPRRSSGRDHSRAPALGVARPAAPFVAQPKGAAADRGARPGNRPRPAHEGGQSPAPASAAASPVSLLKVRDSETGSIAPSATMPPMPASPGAAASGKVAATRPVAPPSPTDLREQALARASDQARRSGLPQASEPPPAVPGRVFRDIDTPGCPEMLEVPAGQFMMGSTDGDTKAHEGEKPQHLVRIGHRLAVGRYPVTFEEYDHFCRSTKRQVPKDRSWGRGRRPVILVSWEDSRAYAEWLRHQTGQHYRLLSEAEWEYACRAGTTTRYWWGDEITAANANFGQNVGRTSLPGQCLGTIQHAWQCPGMGRGPLA